MIKSVNSFCEQFTSCKDRDVCKSLIVSLKLQFDDYRASGSTKSVVKRISREISKIDRLVGTYTECDEYLKALTDSDAKSTLFEGFHPNMRKNLTEVMRLYAHSRNSKSPVQKLDKEIDDLRVRFPLLGDDAEFGDHIGANEQIFKTVERFTMVLDYLRSFVDTEKPTHLFDENDDQESYLRQTLTERFNLYADNVEGKLTQEQLQDELVKLSTQHLFYKNAEITQSLAELADHVNQAAKEDFEALTGGMIYMRLYGE